MKTLRYLLSLIALVSVLSLSAQTPQYGKSYKPENKYARVTTQTDAQLPAATMGTVDAAYMHSGSSLPMAAQSGVTTTYDRGSFARPRRAVDDDDKEDPDTPPVDPHGPNEDPLGDVMWPMALCALAYVLYRYVRTRKRETR